MKKALSALALCSLAFGASDKEILSLYEASIGSQMPNAKISIKERQKAGNTGFESVLLQIEVAGQSEEEILFTKDNLIVPDIIDVKEKKSYRQEFQMKLFEKAAQAFQKDALPILKKEEKFIQIGDAKKPLLYIFSDPECPYCRQHLANIDKDLQDYQLKIILTPVHGRSAFEKAALIYKESKNAKDDTAKIAILKKYFDENLQNYAQDKKEANKALKALPAVSEAEVKAVYELYAKYKKLGLRSVPSFVEDK